MKTGYTLIKPDGETFDDFAMLKPEPNYSDLVKVMAPYFREQRACFGVEHVSVLGRDDRPADMFVDDEGVIYGLPENIAATRIYHRAMVRRGHAHDDGIIPGAPKIAGVAVLFARRVWF